MIGSSEDLNLRQIDGGPQMGDLVKKSDPSYDATFVLPRLGYPNKFYGFTRFRPINRSVETAFWDRVLPKLNKKWSENETLKNK